MKFTPITCPTCGEPAEGTLDTVPGVALLHVDAQTGEAEYRGETEMWWDDQKTILDSVGRYMLCCPNGHDWPATLSVFIGFLVPAMSVTMGCKGGWLCHKL